MSRKTRPVCVLLFLSLLLGIVAAASTITSLRPVFLSTNDKHLVYRNTNTYLTIYVDVEDFALNQQLSYILLATIDGDSAPIRPLGACVTTEGAVIFKYDSDKLVAASAISSASCSFSAFTMVFTPGLKFEHLVANDVPFPFSPALTSSGSQFDFFPSTKYPNSKVDEVISVTILTDVTIDKFDTFFLTASNGPIWKTVTSCVSDETEKQTFSATILDSRIMFTALTDLHATQTHKCTFNITTHAAPAPLKPYLLVAPQHGLNMDPRVRFTPLETTQSPRIGFEGVFTEQGLNDLVVGVPAHSVQNGDTITVFVQKFSNIELAGTCVSKNGDIAASISADKVREYFPASYALKITITSTTAGFDVSATSSADAVSADAEYLYFHCPFMVNGGSPELDVVLVTTPVHSYALMPVAENDSLVPASLYNSRVAAHVFSYGKLATRLVVDVDSSAMGTLSYTDADFSVKGLQGVSLEGVMQTCTFMGDADAEDGGHETIVSVDVDAIHFRLSDTLIKKNNYKFKLDCTFPPSIFATSTFTLHDNHRDTVVVSRSLPDSKLKLSIGEPEQTHFLSGEDVRVPFSLEVVDIWDGQGVSKGLDTLNVVFTSYNIKLQSEEYQCDNAEGSAEIMASFQQEIAAGSETTGSPAFSQLKLQGFATGGTLSCHGFLRVLPLQNTAAVQDTLEVFMSGLDPTPYFPVTPYFSFDTIKTPLAPVLFSLALQSSSLGQPSFLVPNLLTLTHDILQVGQTVQLRFSHALEALPEEEILSCTDTLTRETVFLACTQSVNGTELTCVKQQASTDGETCTIDINFVHDLEAELRITAVFPTPPIPNMMFSPTAVFTVKGGGLTTTLSTTAIAATQGFYINVSTVRKFKKTDVLTIRTTLPMGVGTLQYNHFTPSREDTFDAAIGEVDIDASTQAPYSGIIVLPLSLLDEDSTASLRVYLVHVSSNAGIPGDIGLNIQLNDNSDAVSTGRISIGALGSFRITEVPNAPNSISPVILLSHGGLLSGQQLLFHHVQVTNPSALVRVKCGPIESSGYGLNFYISSDNIGTNPCYIRLPADAILTKPYWSISIKDMSKDPPIRTVTARANTAPINPLTVKTANDASYWLQYQDVQVRMQFEHPLVTTLFTGVVFSFTLAPERVVFKSGSCFQGTQERPLLEDINGAVFMTVPLDRDIAPFETPIYSGVCTMTVQPKGPNTDNALKNIKIFDAVLDDIPLPPVIMVPTSKIDVIFPEVVDYNGLVTVTFQISQFETTAGPYLSFRNSEDEDVPLNQFLEFTSCTKGATINNDQIKINVEFLDIVLWTFTCTGTVRYDAMQSQTYTLVYRNVLNAMKTFTFTAPATKPIITHAATYSYNTATYTITSNRAWSVQIAAEGGEPIGQQLAVDCGLKQVWKNVFEGKISEDDVKDGKVWTCVATYTFPNGYFPAKANSGSPPAAFKLYVSTPGVTYTYYYREDVPFLATNTAYVVAETRDLYADYLFFHYNNIRSNIVRVDNIWSLLVPITEPRAVIAANSSPEQTVGTMVTSEDGKSLIITLDVEYLYKYNDKGEPVATDGPDVAYYACPSAQVLLSVEGGERLAANARRLTVDVGGVSTTAYFTPAVEYSLYGNPVVGKLVPDSIFEHEVVLRVAGNAAAVVVDYSNTTLAAVEQCFARVQGLLLPVDITTYSVAAKVFTVRIVSERTDTTGYPMTYALRCTYRTISTADAVAQLRTLGTTLTLAVVPALYLPAPDSVSSADIITEVMRTAFFIEHFTMPLPHFAPLPVLHSAVTLAHPELLNATRVLLLSQAFARGLRTVVPEVTDAQIRVSEQILVDAPAPTPNPDPTPAPTSASASGLAASTRVSPRLALIRTTFASDNTLADKHLRVIVAVVSTAEVPLTATHLDSAQEAIALELQGLDYEATAEAAVETRLAGDCAYRCGLGCSLCVTGDKCAANAECLDGNCSEGVCRVKEEGGGGDGDGDDGGDGGNGGSGDNDNGSVTASVISTILVVIAAIFAL